jgi:hypothetical protein
MEKRRLFCSLYEFFLFLFPKLKFQSTDLCFFAEGTIYVHETFHADKRHGHIYCKQGLIILIFLNILNDLTVHTGACAPGCCQCKINNIFFFSLSVQHFGAFYMIMGGTAFENIVYLLHF